MHADGMGEPLRIACFEAFEKNIVPAGRLDERALVARSPDLRPVSMNRAAGEDLLERLERLTMELYQFGVDHAEACGIILADTKFEFGLTDAGELLLIDELMTPDSSRYWPKDTYKPGGPQPSFDKQYVRDYLESIRWNKQPPVPSLPDDVVALTRAKYLEAYRRLTGHELEGAGA